MTQQRAERIMELEIREFDPLNADGSGPHGWGAFDGQIMVGYIEGYSKSKSMDGLVSLVYRIRSQECLRRAGWKCELCGKTGVPLQVHHKKFRSHGRKDTLENLIACDAACHEREHRMPRGLKTIEV
jgi:hypothetical protein